MKGYAMNTVESILANVEEEARQADATTPYKGFLVSELKEIFERISDADDWKNPIHATINEDEYDLAAVAVEFFTATRLFIQGRNHEGKIIVEADGYRAGPCGDC